MGSRNNLQDEARPFAIRRSAGSRQDTKVLTQLRPRVSTMVLGIHSSFLNHTVTTKLTLFFLEQSKLFKTSRIILADGRPRLDSTLPWQNGLRGRKKSCFIRSLSAVPVILLMKSETINLRNFQSIWIRTSLPQTKLFKLFSSNLCLHSKGSLHLSSNANLRIFYSTD